MKFISFLNQIHENNMKSIVWNTLVDCAEISVPLSVTTGFVTGGGDGLLGLENFFGTAGSRLSGSRWAFGWVATGGCRTLDLLVWLWELGEEREEDVYNRNTEINLIFEMDYQLMINIVYPTFPP